MSSELIAETAAAQPEAERIEIWLQDEARIGQTGRNCRRWFQRGTRPTGSRTSAPTSGRLGRLPLQRRLPEA